MALKVIGAGLGRNATFSTKFALEHIGFGPCYHMAEVFASARRNVPLWLDVVNGKPDWDAVFDGYESTTDYPACSYWRELADYYPEAKVVLTTRDPDSWFESVSDTIFSEAMQGHLVGTPTGDMMQGAIFDFFDGGDIRNRAFMTDWYAKRNQQVIDTLPAERLLVFHPKDGWEPLCRFLGVEVPPEPFPRVNSRDELQHANSEEEGMAKTPEEAEAFGRRYIDELRAKAFRS
ncbi:sulfotransferase family protein [Parerythrobacter aestuarii]|uniref:sulfotransferase family protein n=1 Tax=Parerythrobacter aestuarii TaxID=3020909 RepID=UPI0024DECD96|nr:sulfotransferase family protein [Parerythrobacter aestuarii]